MPFTPFHMGPGLLIKALLQSSFSLMVFGWAQIVMDIQPLWVLLTGHGHLHGFSHTYIGATLLAIFSSITGYGLVKWALAKLGHAQESKELTWLIALLSGFIGTYSHVAIDSIMHSDMNPLSPWSNHNSLLGIITPKLLHQLCIYSALFGGGLYFVIKMIKKKMA